MNTVLNIALRNLNRQKRRSFLLGGAIAFGVMIVTIINGFAGSFVENVSENFSQLLAGHIFIEGIEKTPGGNDLSLIRNDAELTKVIEAAGIPLKYENRRSSFSGTLIFEGKKALQSVDGVNLGSEKFLKDRLMLKEGNFDDLAKTKRGVILSEVAAKDLNVRVGDSMLVQLKTATGQQNVGEFTLIAVSIDLSLFSQASAYANQAYVNELLNIAPAEYQSLGIMLDSLSQIDASAAKLFDDMKKAGLQTFDRAKADTTRGNPLASLMKQAKSETWQGTRYRLYTLNDILAQVQQIVSVLNTASLVILLVLFLIIMVGITNTFRMIMFERIKEIGTMRAVGMQRNEVRNLFLSEALFLALGGAVAGLALAGLAMGILSLINIGTGSPVFILLKNGHLTFKLGIAQVVADVLIIAVLTTLAALIPARKAAKLNPAVALGTTK
jgi:putative ABC transport system permease protein